jgi:uncharacterized surface protein with fasciclin (FAS1) repeats
MVSQQGYNELNDLKFTYNIKDLNKPNTVQKTNPNTILGLLEDNKDFSIFYNLIVLAKLEYKFSDNKSRYTLLIPSDEYLKKLYNMNLFINMDNYTARELILYHTLNRQITYDMFVSSNAMYLDTMIDKSLNSTILSEKCPDNGIVLNNRARIVVGNIIRDNGIIHVLSDMLIPPSLARNTRFDQRQYRVCS